jgi:transposase
MTRPYSCDLREAAAAAVLIDGMSCREAAELFRVSVSSVVRWTQLKHQNGSCAPKPMGGRRRIILLSERAWVQARLAAEPDLTVRALRAELLARGVRVSYGAVWAFLRAERLSFKKKPVRSRARASGRGAQAASLATLPTAL